MSVFPRPYEERVLRAIEEAMTLPEPNGNWPLSGEPLDYNPTRSTDPGDPYAILLVDRDTGLMYMVEVKRV